MAENNKKTRAEKILEDIEIQLRKLINEKKNIRKKFLDKIKEISKQENENQGWFEDNWKEAEKIENRLMLLWDYWKREVEILSLERKITSGVLPSEREEIMEQIKTLNSHNITLEQGFKNRKIDKKVVTEIRKKIGIWEDESEKNF
ncbi:MAG: hypothetical protein GBAus27B_000572 [Mycoplasmataceae bacterium]|nr:MAG: hypothetical protein GBAus27B_000572 [Mycoplasmataceae bacterium]